MSKPEKNRLLGHADEADGIEEYDNPLPDWWIGLFWLTIVWAIAYTAHYHFIGNRSQPKALAAEVAEAAVRWPQASTVQQLVITPELAARGKAVYAANCTGCHGKDLEGGIGPNLKDEAWIHGGAPEQVLKTITDGVPAKGMLTWGPILGPEKIREVTAFVLSQGPKTPAKSD
ncbi:MAG TPA: cbb3-type cytochrome c oxidase N-terminal domain-containing protein [Gemmatimonadaceae bacterium]|nr:cbb3-type cytochrome c oxidase N-terminal domain-containing protein [Gemmatimonadaceae bacterium]